jgi:hypothetical protein
VRAWLGQHPAHGIAPCQIVSGLPVARMGFLGAIDFYEHEARGVILLSKDLKPHYTWFLIAVASVVSGGCQERVDGLGLDV